MKNKTEKKSRTMNGVENEKQTYRSVAISNLLSTWNYEKSWATVSRRKQRCTVPWHSWKMNGKAKDTVAPQSTWNVVWKDVILSFYRNSFGIQPYVLFLFLFLFPSAEKFIHHLVFALARVIETVEYPVETWNIKLYAKLDGRKVNKSFFRMQKKKYLFQLWYSKALLPVVEFNGPQKNSTIRRDAPCIPILRVSTIEIVFLYKITRFRNINRLIHVLFCVRLILRRIIL